MASITKPRKPVDKPVLQLVGVEDAAARLGTSAKHVRRLVASGELFSVKLGRRRLIPSYTIDEYIRAVIEAEEDQSA